MSETGWYWDAEEFVAVGEDPGDGITQMLKAELEERLLDGTSFHFPFSKFSVIISLSRRDSPTLSGGLPYESDRVRPLYRHPLARFRGDGRRLSGP